MRTPDIDFAGSKFLYFVCYVPHIEMHFREKHFTAVGRFFSSKLPVYLKVKVTEELRNTK